MKITTSTFLDAILENLEYAKPPPPPEPVPEPVPAAAATAPAPDDSGIGGFFRKVVTSVQTATTQVLASPVLKPKVKDQEQVLWAEEYIGMLSGRNNTRRMKLTIFWLMAAVLLVNTGVLLASVWSSNLEATNSLAFVCVAEVWCVARI